MGYESETKNLAVVCEDYKNKEYILVDKNNSIDPKKWKELCTGNMQYCYLRKYQLEGK